MLRLRSIRKLTTSQLRPLSMSTADPETARHHVEELANSAELPFARARIGTFFQQAPSLGNQFTADVTLRNYLRRFLPHEIFSAVEPDLERFGKRVATDIYQLGIDCEHNQPILKQFDAWGNRVDEIVTCEAWKKQKEIAASEGLIATAYERKYQQWSRLLQVVKLYLYAPSSGLFSCPLAMTDGAAKSLEAINDPALNEHAYGHLISRDPVSFWTSGQWMTERRGGSDVGRATETLALPQDDGSYLLHGYKWFTSATDSEMALTLARVVDKDGQPTEGSKGLSMFYLDVRNQDGSLNNIQVQRMKDKLGTRQLPTAELLLDGVRAIRVSDEGRGVAAISNMLTITRLHNSVSAASGMRRITNLSKDFSKSRECFGKVIHNHPIHIRVLANMEMETRAATLLTLEMARLLGLADCGMIAEKQQNIFRLLTPLAKLYTAKQAVAVASEGLESFGGAGYLEDTNLPVHLRDAQVLPIWEGTTNILSLDVLRALAKTKGAALKSFHEDVVQRVAMATENAQLRDSALSVQQASNEVLSFAANNAALLEFAAREFAYSLARIYMGMLLVEHAAWEDATPQDVFVARRWCEQDLRPVITAMKNGNFSSDASSEQYKVVFEGFDEAKSKL
ncbi:hypothetical protein CAPTEDRAFT_179194 [Capitella teleta]|uniref:Acyl-CoA dehydrogenase/oxidase C-terminal domain-containing protein n=1 Tax=Capitella teleta TaxID=283909 RepID=R7U792_CAPTE|nr:hypothetical protein CAPTEDRAFT_179194 [Capitella teleta]|eukprot:ELT99005.1 hypothetical protein CAPTEDRAFT_179194 [Capitella teleta]